MRYARQVDRPPPLFYEIFERLPRQGPGDPAATLRALALLPPLDRQHRVLDIGCGSGAQTLDLARATSAHIVAVDNHGPFLAILGNQIRRLGLGDRVVAQQGDMADLRFPDASYDVIWSEGASFIIGFDQALAAWRRLLRPQGHMVISEMCWLVDSPPAAVRDFLASEAAGVGDVAARRRAVADTGYRLLADFVLPAAAWRENYYAPLAEQVARCRAEHAGDAEALAVTARMEEEIDLYRRHGDSFGYVFFVMARS
jgi:SAM-dependent methyltransferase